MYIYTPLNFDRIDLKQCLDDGHVYDDDDVCTERKKHDVIVPPRMEEKKIIEVAVSQSGTQDQELCRFTIHVLQELETQLLLDRSHHLQ